MADPDVGASTPAPTPTPARRGRASLRGPRRVVAPLLAVVLAVSLAACGGGSDEEDYCSAFLERRQELSDLAGQQAEAAKGGGGVDVLTPTLDAFEDLRAVAPDELQDEWDTLVFAYRDLADEVEATGVDPADFRVGEVPDGLSKRDSQALTQVAAKLGSSRVVEAANGIEGYSAQVCEDADSGTDEGADQGGEPTDEP